MLYVRYLKTGMYPMNFKLISNILKEFIQKTFSGTNIIKNNVLLLEHQAKIKI